MKDLTKIKGEVNVYLNGDLVNGGPNTIVNLGRGWISDRWMGRTSVSGLTTTDGFIAVGYSGGGTTATMSGLILEAPAGSINRVIIGSVVRDVTGSVLKLYGYFFDSGGLGPLQEFGLFSTGFAADNTTLLNGSLARNTGCMIARASKDIVTHTAGDNLTVEWRITI